MAEIQIRVLSAPPRGDEAGRHYQPPIEVHVDENTRTQKRHPVGGAGGLPLGGGRPAGRVRADVAVVRPARTALRVAGAAAIGRYNINGFLE